ncbi:MAG: ABC transporter ATP-binding protein [Desulfovibrio sp.]|nr:ABC transporter ATP-binding protein [Desulfovibrio sp.]
MDSFFPRRERSSAVSPVSGFRTDAPLLRVRDLTVGFPLRGDSRHMGMAVDGVNFTLRRGAVLCLVGESGCGKSVTALSLLRLLPSPPAVILRGSAHFEGQDLLTASEAELRHIRGNRVGMVFQDPMTALNPVMRVGRQMTEGLRLHRRLSASAAKEAAERILAGVGIADPAARIFDFPHQMSGGMRQRVMIGMAIACDPDMLIADEPTTALDVTVQKRILDLLRVRIAVSGSALLLITHDFGVVAQIADDVAVMYAGRIVERGAAAAVLAGPAHPYTVGLLRSRPGMRERKHRLEAIPGAVPGLWSRPAGCAFHPRCSGARAICAREEPPFFAARSDKGGVFAAFLPPETSDSGWRYCRCWLAEGMRIDKSAET